MQYVDFGMQYVTRGVYAGVDKVLGMWARIPRIPRVYHYVYTSTQIYHSHIHTNCMHREARKSEGERERARESK